MGHPARALAAPPDKGRTHLVRQIARSGRPRWVRTALPTGARARRARWNAPRGVNGGVGGKQNDARAVPPGRQNAKRAVLRSHDLLRPRPIGSAKRPFRQITTFRSSRLRQLRCVCRCGRHLSGLLIDCDFQGIQRRCKLQPQHSLQCICGHPQAAHVYA